MYNNDILFSYQFLIFMYFVSLLIYFIEKEKKNNKIKDVT